MGYVFGSFTRAKVTGDPPSSGTPLHVSWDVSWDAMSLWKVREAATAGCLSFFN